MSSNDMRLIDFYRDIKVRFNKKMDDIIRNCNVTLMNTEKIENAFLRIAVQRVIYGVGIFAEFLQQVPRQDVYELQSSFGKVVFVGNESKISSFIDSFFGSDSVTTRHLQRCNLWELSTRAETWLSAGAQMIVIVLSSFYHRKYHSRYVLKTPHLIRQVLFFDKPLDDLLASPQYKNIRYHLRRVERDGIRCEFSRKKEDFDLFYRRMYLPYTNERHGEFALINSYEILWHYFSKGGLLMFYRDSDPVAGSLVMFRGNVGSGVVGGVLDADKNLLRSGIFTAIVWESAKWAESQGLTYIDMGTTSPLRSDGVFHYKKSFGAKVENCYNRRTVNQMSIRSDWYFLMQNPSSDFIDFLNLKGLIVENRGKFYGALFESEVEQNRPQDHIDELKEAYRDGLSGLAIFKPNEVVYVEVGSGNTNE